MIVIFLYRVILTARNRIAVFTYYYALCVYYYKVIVYAAC